MASPKGRKLFVKRTKAGMFKKGEKTASTKSSNVEQPQAYRSYTLIDEIKELNDMAKQHYEYFNSRALGKKDVTVRERGEWSVWSEIMNRTQGMLERHS